jgi:hypothetical protein
MSDIALEPESVIGERTFMDVVLVYDRASGANGKIVIEARVDNDQLHSDRVDVHSFTSRRRFAKKVGELGGEENAILNELAAISTELRRAVRPQHYSTEVDRSKIVRPERVIQPGLSAIAIPTLLASSDGVHGEWSVYLSVNGVRSRTPLSFTIEAGIDKYYVSPMPPEPGLHNSLGWSAASRAAWLDGNEVDVVELFRQLVNAIDSHVEFPDEHRYGYVCTLACWVIQSYVYHAWPSLGYLLVNGPAGSGKSTLFGVLRELVFRPFATDNVSAAAVFRTLHSYGGTLLLDEAERLRDTRSPDILEINGMLLAGYSRGGCATRLEKIADEFKPVNFQVYGPKAIACINGVLPALQSRCIEIRTQRAAKGSARARRSLDATDWQSIRDGLFILALNYGDAWIAAARRRDVGITLHGRDFEIWQPLLSIASVIEGAGIDDLVEVLNATAQSSILETASRKTPEADEFILSVLSEAAAKGIQTAQGIIWFPTASEILERCQQRQPSMFRAFTPKGISNRLSNYGLEISRTNRRREFRVSTMKLDEIAERYGMDLGVARDG